MATNKVILNGEVKIDLTKDTVKPEDVREGKIFHGANGESMTGTLSHCTIISKEVMAAGDYDRINVTLNTYIDKNTTYIGGVRILNHPVKEHHVWWPDQVVTLPEYGGIIYDYPYENWHIHTGNIDNFIKSFCIDGRSITPSDAFYVAVFYDNEGKIIKEFNIPEGITDLTAFSVRQLDSQYDYIFRFPSTITAFSSNLFYNNGGGISVLDVSKVTTPPQMDYSSISYWLNGSATQILIPYESLDAYSNASAWCEVSDIFAPVVTGPMSFFINDVEYSLDKQITWREFLLEHPEFVVDIDEYDSYGSRIYDIIEPTETYYNDVYVHHIIKPGARYTYSD